MEFKGPTRSAAKLETAGVNITRMEFKDNNYSGYLQGNQCKYNQNGI